MLKRLSLIAAMVAFSAAPAFADLINVDATIESVVSLGDVTGSAPRAVTVGAQYSNITSFSDAVVVGGATGTSGTRVTNLVADDINFIGGAGSNVTQLRFTMVNFDSTTARAAAPLVRFYTDNGSNAPGALLQAINFNPVTVASFSITTLTYNVPLAQQWAIPANLKMWAGTAFAATGTAAATTTAQLNNFGVGLFTPVDVGSSLDQDFFSTANGGTSTTTAFITPNPGGSVDPSPYAPSIANHGWEFVPEPTSLALLAIGGLFVARRRRQA